MRRGAPIIVEIGGRDAAGGNVTFMRRDRLRDGDKVVSHTLPARRLRGRGAGACWMDIQARSMPRPRRGSTTTSSTDIKSFDELAEYFGAAEADDEGGAFKGWVRRPLVAAGGRELEAIADRLKALKLTIRNAPLDQKPVDGRVSLHRGSRKGVCADRARLLKQAD